MKGLVFCPHQTCTGTRRAGGSGVDVWGVRMVPRRRAWPGLSFKVSVPRTSAAADRKPLFLLLGSN